MFYNKAIQQWVEVSSGNMDWPGLGPCRVILVREINEGNKNLFYNLTSISAYDELFELNFTRDYYKILYHQEGKYVIPAPEGTLSSMVQEVSEHMIHPEDARRFLEFWEPGRIASCGTSTEAISLKVSSANGRWMEPGAGWRRLWCLF